MDENTSQYETVVSEYRWVKENIKYSLSCWGDTKHTLASKRGHCGAKSELLVSRLRSRGIKARYVEGRPLNASLPILKLAPFSVHFWVEARVDNKWLTLDPSPDSDIACFSGDTGQGSHLGSPQYIVRWEEIPSWFKKLYNYPIFAPFRWLSNIKLAYHRRFCGKNGYKKPAEGQI